MSQKDRRNKNYQIFYPVVWLSTLMLGSNYLKVYVDLVVVAKLVWSSKSLWSRINGIKNDIVLSNEMFDNNFEHLFTDWRE